MVDDFGARGECDVLELDRIVLRVGAVIKTAVAIAAAPEIPGTIRRDAARIGFPRGSAIPFRPAIHCGVVGERVHRSHAAIIAEV